MKILHTVESYDPASHGMQQVVKQLSERLSKLGHDVTVATRFDDRRKDLILNDVKIEQFKISGKYVGGYLAEDLEIERYKNFLINSNFDVITNFAAQQWATDIALPILNQIKAAKIFVPTGFSEFKNPIFKSYFNSMKTWMKNYDMNIFLSDDYQDINFARENGITKTILVPNGAATEEFDVKPIHDIRKRFNIPENHSLILHVGSHTGLKGHRETIKIFKKAKISNATLLIIGNSVHSNALVNSTLKFVIKSLANAFLIFSKKRFYPSCTFTCRLNKLLFRFSHASIIQNKNLLVEALSRRETVDAYITADLFLFPSNIECSPIVLFESMASKTPFLTTDVGNSKEIISWSNSGLILPTKFRNGYSIADITGSAKVLKELISDKFLRQQMASIGFENWRNKFTWKKIAKQYEEIYSSLLIK